MPGKRINSRQIRMYMEKRKEKSQKVAAAQSGFCERTARYIERRGFQPANSQRVWKTRKDPFEEVWKNILVPMLEKDPKLQANTLLEYLQHNLKGEYPDKLLRTLQRRLKKWRALYGPEKEVIFRQKHPPGEQGLSDFTSANHLQITIQGETFDHLLYHYRLAYSGWEYAEVVLGGESFTALTEQLQNALWQCGGVPKTHRTDSLSAAFKNLSSKQKNDLTNDYESFCEHYNMKPTRNNKGVSHENGSIESSHRHLKSQLEQALLIRGSRDFSSLEEYRQFVRDIVKRHNRRIQKKYLEEFAHLQPLPERKTTDYTEERVVVTNSSMILVKGVLYSVPSRLIGEILKIHLYDDRFDCFIGGSYVMTLPRKRKQKRYERQIDYRHLIEAFSRKPGAFKNYIHKDAFFPTLAFRQTWEYLERHLNLQRACKEYIAILKEGAKNEQDVSRFLEKCLTNNEEISGKKVLEHFSSRSLSLPEGEVSCDSLATYANLLRRMP